MADLTQQLTDLNNNAKELLQKYDGAFSKIENLSEQKQKELSDFVSKQIDFIKKNYGNIDLDAIRKEIEGKASDAIKEIEDKVKNSIVKKVKIYDFPFNSNYSSTSNVYDDNTLFDVNIPVEKGDVLFIKGFISGHSRTDNNTHILDRFKIDNKVVRDSGTIVGNTYYGHTSAHCVYVATETKTVNIKYQMRSGGGYTIDSHNDDGWGGARLTIINFKGANNE